MLGNDLIRCIVLKINKIETESHVTKKAILKEE